MMKELDRTLELAPEHLDALSAKGPSLSDFLPCLGETGKRVRSFSNTYS
jgi:hypothetical protein